MPLLALKIVALALALVVAAATVHHGVKPGRTNPSDYNLGPEFNQPADTNHDDQ